MMDRRLDEKAESGALRGLPLRVPPAGFSTALRVLASRERQRLLSRRTWTQSFSDWQDRARLFSHNLMRRVPPL